MGKLRAFWAGLAALACLSGTPAAAQTGLFLDEATLHITIDAPFPLLLRTAPLSTNPYPATLSAAEGANAAQIFQIQVRARGVTRRTGGYCQFPPLALDFDEAALEGTLFQGQNRLKLVTFCRPEAAYEQRVVLEYLAYRFYNLLTPLSYRVRLAEVIYRNSGSGRAITRLGFLIEDIDDVAHRNHLAELKAPTLQIGAAQLDARASARAALFEFMIGNLDWDFLAGPQGADCCHNSRLLAARNATPASATAIAPLPYDFDYSGMVDAPYASPPLGLRVRRVTDRLYRGYCVSGAEIPATAAEFQAHRVEVLALINHEAHLNANFRGKTARFIEGFFAVLDDPTRLEREIVGHCRHS